MSIQRQTKKLAFCHFSNKRQAYVYLAFNNVVQQHYAIGQRL